MFDLVADVESYPQFLPGCTASQVLSREGQQVTASLSLSKGPLQAAFTTRNELVPPERMTMELVDGPFRTLHGEWRFEPLGNDGCRVELLVRFEFDGWTRDLLLGPAFESTCNSLLDAFIERARKVYADEAR